MTRVSKRRTDTSAESVTRFWRGAQISRQPRTSGQTIGDSDILIAATALHHGLPLVTDNAHHFQRITGVQIIGYRPNRERFA